MQIELGKYYCTRDGQKVGPMCHPEPSSRYGWNTPGLRRGRWDIDGEDGEATGWGKPSGGDLIAEWVDTPDLTAITTPFGLLDDATREALKAHGGPIQRYDGSCWIDVPMPTWGNGSAYRVKPQPSKPREWWLIKSFMPFDDRKAAESWANVHGLEIIHVREVIDNA